jgi:hypothetical protein
LARLHASLHDPRRREVKTSADEIAPGCNDLAPGACSGA